MMWLIAAIVMAMVGLIFWSPKDDRVILTFLAISTAYYCLGGSYYWGMTAKGVFEGASWGESVIVETAAMVAIASFLWAAGIWITTRLSQAPLPRFINDKGMPQPWSKELVILLAFAVGSSFYILKNSSFLGDEFSFDTAGPFFLILWAASDVLLPVLMFMIATRGYTKGVLALIAYFIVYAVLGGFRYKLALLFLPILWDAMTSKINIAFKIGLTALMGGSVLGLFAVMTLYRAKFGVPDFSVPLSDPGTQLLFGLFADANILFGQASIIANYVNTGMLVPFDPVLDTFKEWIPRVLYPTKSTGAYAQGIVLGMGTIQGANSHTAYPWVGEFMMMMGWWAMIVAPLVMIALYMFLKAKLRKHSATARQYTMGLALVAAMMGYYQFSRPYMPQISKGYVFIVAPYIYLCARDKTRRRTAALATQSSQRGPATA
jgi:hypothetical protein